MSAYSTSMKAPKNYLLFFPGIFRLTMRLCGMFKELKGRKRDEQEELEKSVHSGVVTESSQPLQDRKEYEISSLVTESSQLLQDRKEYEISSVVSDSSQLLQDRKEYEISSVVIDSSQPFQDRKEYEISSVVTKSNQLLQDRKDVVTNSNQPFQDREGCEISEEIAPVAHISSTDIEISNVGKRVLQGADGGELQDVSGGELQGSCNLPNHVLLSILECLMSLGDFFAFSHVCREWRFVSEFRKREYMAAQPPLLCGSLIRLGFYSWKEERFYKKELHQINIRLLNMGFSHGFLISLHSGPDKKYFGLVNPVTGVEVMASFPVLPKCIVTLPLYATLMSPPTSPDCMLLIVAAYFICLCRPGDQEWIIHPRVYEGGAILGVLFFKGKIYGINNGGHILIYDHVLSKFTFCRARNDLLKYDQITKIRRMIWLADCGGELFVILCLNTSNGLEEVKFVVRRFNFTTCKWVSVKHLGNHVLFLDRRGAAFWDDAANWGDSGNCIYYFSECIHGNKFHVFHMNDGRVENLSFPEHFYPSYWIFPRLCC